METKERIIDVIIWATATSFTAIILSQILPTDFKPSTLFTLFIASLTIGLLALGIINKYLR